MQSNVNRYNKWLCFIILLCISASVFAGCTSRTDKPDEEAPTADQSISIYASFYPLFALTHMLVEDIPEVQLNCLVQPQDGCLRNYQISEWDLALLTYSADAVISGGRGLESFENLLFSLGDAGPAVSAVLYNMELSEKKAINTQTDSESHWIGGNPHIYMKTQGAAEILNRIASFLQVINPQNSESYQAKLENAQNRLKSLSKELKSIISGCTQTPVALLNEALIYCAEEYKLDVALCYERESGEGMETSALAECLEILGRSGARVVLLEKQAPEKLQRALRDAGYSLALMDTLSTRRASEGSEGYFEAMLENAHALKEAFQEASAVHSNAGIS